MEHALLDALVGQALAAAPRASDLLFPPAGTAGALVDGAFTPLPGLGAPTSPPAADALARELLGRDARLAADLARLGGCDVSYRHPSGWR
ncbi:MAG TPA: twitching motility protein, partial [Solidesulfovibrio magneticus]|nr:twitching motility protein [Solidesulfovibrio magneticus]